MTETTSAERRPTSADVARASGFSRATVSYVLNNTPRQSIPEGTRRRILAAAADLGYSPSAAAAALRRGHSNVVLVVKDAALRGYITEPFIGAITAGLREAGHTPLVTDLESEEALLLLAQEIRPLGVIALTSVTPELVQGLASAGVPKQYHSVLEESPHTGGGDRPWEEAIGHLQATHLLDGGAAQLVYAAPADSPRTPLALSRALGANRAAAERSAPAVETVFVDPDRRLATEQIRSLVPAAASPEILGICAFDDVVAATVLAATADLGIAVPGRLRVIGVDDTPFAALTAPPLTTVRIDAERSGSRVVQRFLAAEDEPDAATAPSTLHVVRRFTT